MDKKKFNLLLDSYKTDRNSFIELYEYYFHRIVYHISIKFGKTFAEDIAQEFFVKLMRIQIDEPVEYPTTWVYTVCDNLAKSLIKKYKSYEELTGNEYYELQSDISEREVIRSAMKDLDEIDKKIVGMFYWEGYSLKEIADILKLSYEMVKKRHARLLKKLNKNLKKLSPN